MQNETEVVVVSENHRGGHVCSISVPGEPSESNFHMKVRAALSDQFPDWDQSRISKIWLPGKKGSENVI